MEYIKRIEKSLKNINKTSAEMLRDLEYSKGLMSNWKKGTEPSAIKLLNICDYLGVSIDYILTGKEGINKELVEEEKELISYFRKLTDKEKMKEIARLELITENREENTNIDKDKLLV